MAKDYGAAVSQRGYDVKTCADRFLLYSSAFQTLKIHSIVKVTGTLPITITHNIGHYVPFEVIAHNAPQYAYQDWKRIPFSDGQFYNSCTAKGYTDRIVLEDGEYDEEVSNSYTVIIYLDNFETVAEKVVNTGTTLGSYSTDYGFRVSKAGYDVKTCTDIQCIFSSKQGFSEIVHKKGINTERSGQCQVSHNQGTPLKFLAFQKKTTESFLVPCIRRGRTTLTFDGAYIDSNYLYMGVDTGAGGFSNSYDFYYIMFKNRLS
jgi:hypothetical protein